MSVDHWQCPICEALHSNDELNCESCGTDIPPGPGVDV